MHPASQHGEDRKRHIIAVTEVNSKLNTKFAISELNITGYQIFHNIALQGESGVLLYVQSLISVTELDFSDIYKDAVSIKITLSDNVSLTLGNVYRSFLFATVTSSVKEKSFQEGSSGCRDVNGSLNKVCNICIADD